MKDIHPKRTIRLYNGSRSDWWGREDRPDWQGFSQTIFGDDVYVRLSEVTTIRWLGDGSKPTNTAEFVYVGTLAGVAERVAEKIA